MEKRNIVLIDDHVVVRNGLKELIEKLGPYSISAQFDSGVDFLEALPSVSKPDLVVMDLAMPGMSGDQVMEKLNAEAVEIPVLILTLESDDQTVIRLFRNGIRGFLRKDCSADALRSALEAIFHSGYYHNEYLILSLRSSEVKAQKTEQEKILERLTDREKKFLRLVCHEDEYTYEQIADQMQVQHRTVDGYREAVFDKFGIKSKTGLVLFILRHQLFEHLED